MYTETRSVNEPEERKMKRKIKRRAVTVNVQCFAARLADVRSLASVDTDVHGQSRSLNERLSAVAKLTSKGTFLAVDTSVSVIAKSEERRTKSEEGKR